MSYRNVGPNPGSGRFDGIQDCTPATFHAPFGKPSMARQFKRGSSLVIKRRINWKREIHDDHGRRARTDPRAPGAYGSEKHPGARRPRGRSQAPRMYIGDVHDGRACTTSYGEVVDNAVDEHLGGFCSRLDVTVHPRRLGHGRGQRSRHPTSAVTQSNRRSSDATSTRPRSS